MAVDEPILRRCRDCNQQFSESEFTRIRGKLQTLCKYCNSRRAKEWARRNKDRPAVVYDLSQIRQCKVCEKAQPLTQFPECRGRRYYTCKDCSAKNGQRWADANRERVRLQKEAYAQKYPERVQQSKKLNYETNADRYTRATLDRKRANKDAVNARYRAQYAKEPEKWKARQKRYEQRFPERVRAMANVNSSRRRKHAEASPTHYTRNDVLRLYAEQKGRCAEPTCKISIKTRYHVDHIMPLCKGGTNGPENIQLLCAKCNLRKHDKDPLEWARLNGRLF